MLGKGGDGYISGVKCVRLPIQGSDQGTVTPIFFNFFSILSTRMSP